MYLLVITFNALKQMKNKHQARKFELISFALSAENLKFYLKSETFFCLGDYHRAIIEFVADLESIWSNRPIKADLAAYLFGKASPLVLNSIFT